MAACHSNEHLVALRISHDQTVLIRVCVENRNVMPGRLLDQCH
ncbi:hypothetical protein ACFOLD_09370 [Kocuria carniphila]